jgi:hypothetical protein
MREKLLLIFAIVLALLIGSVPFLVETQGDLTNTGVTTNNYTTDSNIMYPANNNSQNQYSIEQATSDKAQLNTLAFSGLGFLTGNLCCDSFLPPGKLADFFGFQYLRDTTQTGQGHSTDFLTNCADNVLWVLNDTQKGWMITLAQDQADQVNQFAYMRYPLMVAFRRQLTGDLPSATTNLSRTQVMNYSASLYYLDGQISIARAKLYANVLNSLNTSQSVYLTNMTQAGFASWPALGDQLKNQHLNHDQQVLVMTYASEMFGWFAGNLDADTYFCPERNADYFGGFYIKDAPAIGNPGYVIDETITGERGAAFISALNSNQQSLITSLVDVQRSDLTSIVETRREISTELRKALSCTMIDEAKVLQLETQYGMLDGEIAYNYAVAFAKVGQNLTEQQNQQLWTIRGLENDTTLNRKIYLFSSLINVPVIQNTDFLFDIPQATPTPSPTPTAVTPVSTATQAAVLHTATPEIEETQHPITIIAAVAVGAVAILAIAGFLLLRRR